MRRERFLRDLARFAGALGAVAAAVIAGAYLAARGPLDRPLVEARTVAVGAAILAGLAIVLAVERAGGRRVRPWVWAFSRSRQASRSPACRCRHCAGSSSSRGRTPATG